MLLLLSLLVRTLTPISPLLSPSSFIRLELEEMRMRGYGPYREEVVYPLSSRGLVLVTGKNYDDSAADSNAAGESKSSRRRR